MSGIFISYRRADTAYQAGHIYDRLAQYFGEEVFKDVDSISLGDDFVRVINDLIGRSAVVLVLIGDDWLAAAPATGRPRLDDPNDIVRREIELALQGQKVVIPLVLGQAQMPKADEIPESIRALVYRSGMRVNPAPDFYRDMERLIRTLEQHVRPGKPASHLPEGSPAAAGPSPPGPQARGNRFLRVLGSLLAQDYPQEQRQVDVRTLAHRLFAGWRFGTQEHDRREDLQALVAFDAQLRRAEVEAIAIASAPSDAPLRSRIRAYLTQVILRVGHSLGRSDRPVHVRLDEDEDLWLFLPAYWPRFRPGDRPLAQVDWELVELLGAGGYGEVWKAHNPEFPGIPPVALKFCLDESVRQKLLGYEAHLISQVLAHGSHPGIVPLRQAYLKADPPCLEYEFVEGGDLVRLPVAPAGPQRIAQVRGWIRQLAETVGHFHLLTPPIVHRDLKPANVLVARLPSGEVRLRIADFGIGRLVADMEHGAAVDIERSPEVKPPTAIRTSFTPLYASPQQQRGELPDPRDDVYSLGIIWYQLLIGNPTVGAPRGLKWSRDLNVMGMSADDLELLGACLEEEQDLRPANAAELARRLGALPARPGTGSVLRLHEFASAPSSAAATPRPSGSKLTIHAEGERIRVGVDELPGDPAVPPSGGSYSPSPGTIPLPPRDQPTVVRATPSGPSGGGRPTSVASLPTTADTESGTFRALWLWFAICQGAASLLWACFLLFLVVAGSKSMGDEEFRASMGLLLMLAAALYLVDAVLWFLLLHRCWALLQDVPQTLSPGLAVGLLFVPGFNLFWIFVACYGLARALNTHLRRCQIWKPQASEGLGLTACILSSLSTLAFLLGFAQALGLFGVTALLLSLANSVLWNLFMHSLTQAATALAAARNDSEAQPA